MAAEKFLGAMAVLLFLSASVYGLNGFAVLIEGASDLERFFDGRDIKPAVLSEINDSMSEVPAFLFSIFGNKKINLYIELNNGSELEYFVATGHDSVETVSLGTMGGADLEVRLKEATVKRIANSANPVGELASAFNSGEITYKGLTSQGQTSGIIVSVVSTVVGIVNSIAGFIGGLFG